MKEKEPASDTVFLCIEKFLSCIPLVSHCPGHLICLIPMTPPTQPEVICVASSNWYLLLPSPRLVIARSTIEMQARLAERESNCCWHVLSNRARNQRNVVESLHTRNKSRKHCVVEGRGIWEAGDKSPHTKSTLLLYSTLSSSEADKTKDEPIPSQRCRTNIAHLVHTHCLSHKLLSSTCNFNSLLKIFPLGFLGIESVNFTSILATLYLAR